MRRHAALTGLLLTTLALSSWADDKPRGVDATEQGFVLPNGWTISPAGEQVVLTDLPLNIIPLADNHHSPSRRRHRSYQHDMDWMTRHT